MSSLVRSLPRPRMPAIPSRRLLKRRLLTVTLIAAALLAGYMLWLRNSSLVAVEAVTINGAAQNPSVEEALRAAALEQSTLNLDLAALRAAVTGDPAVRGVSAQPDFPHGLVVDVDIREPVGLLKGAGLLVAGDGVILNAEGAKADSVPTIGAQGDDLVGGASVKGEALEIARVLGAAPQPLLAEVVRASIEEDFGVVVELNGGLELRFGDPGDADPKWRGAAAVLAHNSFTGAAYIDLSVPDRPVAGGVPETDSGEQVAAATEEAAAAAAPADPAVPVEPAAVEPAPVEAAPATPEPVPEAPAEGAVAPLE